MAVIGATQLEPVNVLGSYVQGLEAGRAAQAQRLKEAQDMAAAQRETEFRNFLSSADLSKPETQNKLLRFGKPGVELATSMADIASKRATTTKAQLETKILTREQELAEVKAIREALSTAKDPSSWQILRQQAEQAGLDLSNVPEEYDPLYVQTLADNTLGYEKWLSNKLETKKIRIQGGQLKQSQARLDFDRNVETWKRENPDHEIKETSQGLVAINKKTGAVKPIIHNGEVLSGAPKSADPRVDEQNAAFNTKRILNSAQRIVSAVERSPGALSAGLFEASARGIPFFGEGTAALLRSNDRQIVENNYEGVIDALLFLSTGAAYNKEQRQAVINEIKPLFTDKKEALADKKEKLLEYIEAAKIKSGRAWTPELDSVMKTIADMYGSAETTEPTEPAPEGVDPKLWAVMTPDERAEWQKN